MKRLATAAACLIGLAACEFERADEMPLSPVNTCSLRTDCAGGGDCVDGMCVASATDGDLEIALLITPLPTGSETPHPVLVENINVNSGSPVERIELRAPVAVSGNVRNGGSAIDAALSFTPVHAIRGIAAPTISASTTRARVTGNADYAVQLSSGVEYILFVRPADSSLPPWRTTFTAGASAGPSVDFAELETRTQTYLVKDAPTDRVLLVQALDASDQPLSSVAPLAKGKATLVFATEAAPYRLQIRAQQSYEPMQETMPAGVFCDDDTPVYPVFSVADRDLAEPNSDGAIEVPLPASPERIQYEGTIALCGDGDAAIDQKKAPGVMELPVYLHSKNILADKGAFSASFDAQTMAQFDHDTGEFTFCVQLMEGDYDVVVTPPTSVPCAVYAQQATIDAPDGMAARGMRLELPNASALRGTLETLDEMPLAGATVDAVALGRVVPVVDNPAVTTRYNRSRQTTTAESGTFEVPVDFGGYDLVIKPPANSGYSWQVRHDVVVGAVGEFSDRMEVASPVMLNGRLDYAKVDPAKLAGAEVLAYALIDEKPPEGGDVAVVSQRAVPIGKATADVEGVFMLLLPQAITSEW
jgi:hypothetical protein